MFFNNYFKLKLFVFYFILFQFLFLQSKSTTINSNATGGGNWSATATWASATVPTTGVDVVIQNGDNVTIDATTNNLNSVTINATGTLTIAANTFSLIVTNGGTKTITVNGLLTLSSSVVTTSQLLATTLTIANGGIFQNSCGKATAVTITNFNINNGGTYNHDAVGSGTAGSVKDFPGCSGSSTNNIVLGTSSNINITKWGVASQSPPALPTNASSGIAYGNLTINVSTAWSGSWQLGSSGTSPCIGSVAGNFSVQATGGQEMRLVSSANATAYTLNISGNFSVSGGTLVLVGGGGSAAQNATCNVSGNVLVSGGTIDMNSNQNAVTSTLNISGNLTLSGTGTIIRSKSATGTINFNAVSSVQTISSTTTGLSANAITYNVGTGVTTNTVQLISNLTFSPKSVVNVLNAATLDCQTYQLLNSSAAASPGAFNLNSGGTIKLGDPNGITASSASGNVQMGFTRTYSTGANYYYTGSITQVTGDGLPATVNNLTIINSSASITTTLTNNVSVTSIINLVSGLSLASHTITALNNSTNAITYSTGYIISETNLAINPSVVVWNMGTTIGAFVFPFGVSGGTQIPFTFSKTSAGAATVQASTRATAAADNLPWAGISDAGTVNAVTDMNDASGTDISTSSIIDRWWDIYSPDVVTADITFSYLGTENTAINQTGFFQAQHWNGTSWDTPVGSGNGVTSGIGTVTVTGVTTFSPWVLSSAILVLPVALLNFTATCNNNQVELVWSTGSETNNNYFTIERSADGFLFEEVAKVKGAGNSNKQVNYLYTDKPSSNKYAYYRLSQTDFNNNKKVYHVLHVNSCVNNEDINVYINEASNFMLNFDATSANYNIAVFDAIGQQIRFTNESVIKEGDTKSVLVLNNLPNGIYFVCVTNSNNTLVYTKKLLKCTN
jgi:hypothetical protein